MDVSQIGMKLTLDALEVQASAASFNDRLMVQKAIYLAQAAGLDLGYYFRWYLRGPYSPEVSGDVFAIAAELREFDESRDWVLDQEIKDCLAPVKKLISAKPAGEGPRWLELLASAHFLVDRRQVPGADVDRLQEVLRRFDKEYTDDEVSGALESLQAHGLLPG